MVEFDSPPPILLRGRKVQPVDYEERRIDGKTIQEAVLELADGDWVVFLSDGVLNAGIGGVYPLGWGWEQAARFLEKHAHRDLSAEDLAGKVAEAVGELYADRPGDDVSIAVIKVRHKRVANVLTGPPSRREQDEEWVEHFTQRLGRRVVCGGTTAKIVARQHGADAGGGPVHHHRGGAAAGAPARGGPGDRGHPDPHPGARPAGRAGTDRAAVRFQVDGASSLLRLLLGVDHVHFLVGQAVNPAHQNPDLPHQLGIRVGVVREIVEELRQRGTEVTVEEI